MSRLLKSTVKDLNSSLNPVKKLIGKRKKDSNNVRATRRYNFPEEDELLSSREKMELMDFFNDDN